MSKKILIIDDQPDILEVLREILELLGHEVTSEASGSCLNGKIDISEFDLVITDYQMPDMTGVEIAKKIKRSAPEKNVYIISGYHQLLSEQKMAECGIKGVLNKPFDLDQLKRILSE